MGLLLLVVEIVAPVLLIGAIGFGWVKAGFDYPTAFVTRLSMTLAVPALIFTALMKTTIAPAALSAVMLAALLGYGLLALVFWGLLRLGRLSVRTFLSPLTFGNTGNVGLPLALFAFGEAGFAYAVIIFAVMAIGTFTLGLWLVAGGGSPFRALREPVTWSTLLGALFLWQGWQTPDWLTSGLDLLAQLAIPIMLLTLGVAIARLRPGQLRRAFALSALRVPVCIGVAAAAGLVLGLDPVALAVLILQLSTPVAVTSYMLAVRHGAEADADAVAGLVLASTLLGIATLPLTLAFLI